jgi:CheY-like chemotaxis protein
MTLTSLVVCADAKVVQVLSRVLREMGIRAEHCGDPRQVADRLKTDRFDAVLVDCENETSAKELISIAKSNPANKAALILVIADAGNHIREVFSAGANFVLYKPVSAERANNSLRAARSLMPNERRKKPRLPLYGPVSIAYGTSENVPANLLDMSEEGVAIRSERALAPSCRVYFEFKLPDQTSSVRLSGEVVWTDFTGRVGLQFARVPQAYRQLMDGWLRESLFRQQEAATVPPEFREEKESPSYKTADPSLDVAGNRRVQSRVTCRLGAEVYAPGSKVPHRSNLIDISPGGCYIESMSPLPPGTVVDIIVRTEELKIRLKGKIRSAHAGYGMGVEFLLSGTDDKANLRRLMALQSVEA